MGKIVAFDIGGKRTGVAITDDLQIIASPLEGVETSKLHEYIAKLMAQESIETFVVGDPSMFGAKTDSSAIIDAFCIRIKKDYPSIPLHRVDESFSSSEAVQSMIQGGMKKSKRREKMNIDKVSAAIILQRYLSEV